MGTRSITRVISNNKPILTFYRQFDGYPSGHGKELADFMAGICIINGFDSSKHAAGTHANGAGCFAAQLVEKLKGRKLGGIYLSHHDCDNEEYNYTITLSSKPAGAGEWGGGGFYRIREMRRPRRGRQLRRRSSWVHRLL